MERNPQPRRCLVFRESFSWLGISHLIVRNIPICDRHVESAFSQDSGAAFVISAVESVSRKVVGTGKFVELVLVNDPAVTAVHVNFEAVSLRLGELREVIPIPNQAVLQTA